MIRTSRLLKQVPIIICLSIFSLSLYDYIYTNTLKLAWYLIIIRILERFHVSTVCDSQFFFLQGISTRSIRKAASRYGGVLC